MWPFSKPEPDNRPPCAAAKAIAKSLREEPGQWGIGTQVNFLVHADSLISIDTEYCNLRQPWTTDEPDANEELIREAVNDWVAARLAMPEETDEDDEAGQ